MFVFENDLEDLAYLGQLMILCFSILLVWFIVVCATLSDLLFLPAEAWKTCGINRALCGWLVVLLSIIWVPYYWCWVRPKVRRAGGK